MLAGKKNPRIILGVVLIVLMLLLIGKQLVVWQENRQTLVTERGFLTEANMNLQRLMNLEKQSVNIQAEIDQLARLMPNQPAEKELINDLNTMVARRGLHITKIAFDKYEDKKEYTEIPFQLTMEGEYLSLLGLLQDLEKGPRAIQIKEISINKAQPELPLLVIDINASTFYLNQ